MPAVWRDSRDRLFTTPSMFVVGVVVLAVALMLGWSLWVLALAILIPTGVAVYKRPQRGILILAVLLPFDGMLKALAPAWTNPWKQVFILALVALTFICPPEARAQEPRKLPAWLLPWAGLLSLCLGSSVLV